MIRYAGVQTLLPTPELAAFINANLPLGLAQYYCPPGGGAEIGATAPNVPRDTWTQSLTPKINCLYWPTGASRWATMLLLVDSDMLDDIVPATSTPVSADYTAASAQLVIADSQFTGTITDDDWSVSESGDLVAMSTAMYALKPHPISTYSEGSSKTLWILPIVDERYFWQWKNVGTLAGTPASWATLINHFETRLGVTITEGDISDIYATVFSLESYAHANAATILDAILRTIGHRFVRRITGENRTHKPSEAVTIFDANTTDPDGPTHKGIWKDLAGGAFSYRGSASMPESVKVIGEEETEIKTVSVSSVGGNQWREDTEVTIFVTYPNPEDYPVGTDEDDFAEQVATDWVAWRSRTIDRAFIGVKSWSPSGFEDFFLISHGELGQSPCTRVVTRPENTSVEHWIGGTASSCANYYTWRTSFGAVTGSFEWQLILESDRSVLASGTYTIGTTDAAAMQTALSGVPGGPAVCPVSGTLDDINGMTLHPNRGKKSTKWSLHIPSQSLTPPVGSTLPAFVVSSPCCVIGG